jgi:adenine-specific DNA-methyltransferase
MNKMEGTSLNLETLNVEKIKELFPNVVTEGKIDFDKLRVVLGDEIDDRVEKYQFTWNGKSSTIKLAQSPSTGTLIPSKADSKNWDKTENLYIEGDNLEVLKQLQKTYYGKIKMIYIDPPYNTGGDFVYKDDFKDNIKNYKEQTQQTTRANPETNGRYHTDWLNMMYSRLMLAKNLLTNDGVMFISIDDNEVVNLKKICDDIFGEYNFISFYLWTKTSTPPSLSNKYRKTVEYVLCYEKNKNSKKYYGSELENGDAPLLNTGNPIKTLKFPAGSVRFSFIINSHFNKGDFEKVRLENNIDVKNGLNSTDMIITGEFKWGQENLEQEIKQGTTFIIKSEKFSIRFQRTDDNGRFKTPNNFFNDIELNKTTEVGTNESAVSELTDIGLNGIFDYPKPTSLISKLINMVTYDDKASIILDFFSGSATTAHAVMQLNSEDGGNRKFIMVQLPELTDESSEAYKAGYKNICEIGKERIRRAGEQIKQELIDKKNKAGLLDDNIVDPDSFDNGFKVFKLESTNIIPWDGTIKLDETTIFTQSEVIKEDRSDLDVLYEVMLKYGVFDKPVQEININGKTMYSVSLGYLIVCLDNNITLDDVKEIGKLKPHNVIFKESGFANDNDKINATYTLEKLGVEEIKSI